MKKLVSFVMTLAMVLSLAACGGGQTAPSGASSQEAQPESTTTPAPSDSKTPVKVALILPGIINDAGWSAAAYNGLVDAKSEFGIETAYSESVPLTEQESTMRDYASQGYNLIICHGDEYTDAAISVAEEFPNVAFAVTNGRLSLPNAIGMDVKNEEQGFVAGYALGLLTKSNKVGFVSSMELVAQKRVQYGFEQGVKAANPDASVSVTYVGSFDDTTKAKESALALFELGCDTVFQYAQSAGIGVVQAAAEKGITMVVTSPKQAEMNPGHTAMAVQTDMKANIYTVIKEYVNGNFTQDLAILGCFSTGLFQVGAVDNAVIPEDVMAKVQEKIDALTNGTLSVDSNIG